MDIQTAVHKLEKYKTKLDILNNSGVNDVVKQSLYRERISQYENIINGGGNYFSTTSEQSGGDGDGDSKKPSDDEAGGGGGDGDGAGAGEGEGDFNPDEAMKKLLESINIDNSIQELDAAIDSTLAAYKKSQAGKTGSEKAHAQITAQLKQEQKYHQQTKDEQSQLVDKLVDKIKKINTRILEEKDKLTEIRKSATAGDEEKKEDEDDSV